MFFEFPLSFVRLIVPAVMPVAVAHGRLTFVL
jgi:hypothetical protein